MSPDLSAASPDRPTPTGAFVDFGGERYYIIRDFDRMRPFLISVISSADPWLFVSTTGGLTAGRVSPETALFPYITVDKLHDAAPHTGGLTVVRVGAGPTARLWEPFNRAHDGRYATSRNLLKSTIGERLIFEEINHDLGLVFRAAWSTSDRHGIVRDCELENLGETPIALEIVDGVQNLLPAGTPSYTQTNGSNLVDAYKWTELLDGGRLAAYALYAAISDRAEPRESLRANVVYGLGLDGATVLLSSRQLAAFRSGQPLRAEAHTRGVRGAYFLGTHLQIPAGATERWTIVADVERTQVQIVDLARSLRDPAALAAAVRDDIARGRDELSRIVASVDGFQVAAHEVVTVHHYANALFNGLRGGVFADQYRVSTADFDRTIDHFHRGVRARHADLLTSLPAHLPRRSLLQAVRNTGDPQLERLALEYLPITFGRRHGDPSRPWNRFSIRVRDENGDRALFYEGNWRDIFQNWEALTLSYPAFLDGIIAKFVNASTVDGYNPYRITKEGIDWEVEHPDDPWSNIGYWGDHQIIYLLKLLEASRRFDPTALSALLYRRVFSYADVPYRLREFSAIVQDPKHTVDYDQALAAHIEARVAERGADGKLVHDASGEVYLVTLAEKLLVPLLAKLGNLVLDGGIWLSTQRPEWNDANNALVGQGLSVVTLCYMRRYLRFLLDLFSTSAGAVALTAEVATWLADTTEALHEIRPWLGSGPVSPSQRWRALELLGQAASRYRAAAYAPGRFASTVEVDIDQVRALLGGALIAVDHSVAQSWRDDGMVHAYNVLDLAPGHATIGHLYPMLEGQVAVLSSGALSPDQAAALVQSLYSSDLYRPDQHSFLLYPDRPLQGFLQKNRVPADRAGAIGLLATMLDAGDPRILTRDAEGELRFHPDLTNARALDARLDALVPHYGQAVHAARAPLRALYEDVFQHREFTGRSGTMFGFEGLGCIYWHMVSKLLLAVQENFLAAIDQGAPAPVREQLGRLYYQVRDGIGFNKTPAEYGAFPTDPYSHTPGDGGARQPGMTGQVKEEVLTRFGELGVRIDAGAVRFEPALLAADEFAEQPGELRYLDIDGRWQTQPVPARGLAYTWCQVPIVYRLVDSRNSKLTLTLHDGTQETASPAALTPARSAEVFQRTGKIRLIEIEVPRMSVLGSLEEDR